jgi:hypothetical protein
MKLENSVDAAQAYSLATFLILGLVLLYAGIWTAAAVYAVFGIADEKVFRREIWLYNDMSTTVVVQGLDVDRGTRQRIRPGTVFKAKANGTFLGSVAESDVVMIGVFDPTGRQLDHIATQGNSFGWMQISGYPTPTCISVAAEPPAKIPGRTLDDAKPCSRATR